MPVAFENFSYSYENKKKKRVFVPSPDGRRIGRQVKRIVESVYNFDPFYWHFREGGHIAALHIHRSHEWFARIDLKNFFYSIPRQRIQRALRARGVIRHEYFAKWSTVKTPNEGSNSYVLPYGFVQSPILASLVLSESTLGQHLRTLPEAVSVGVYLDDISLSSNSKDVLEKTFDELLALVEPSGFAVNPDKVERPAPNMTLFNCDLRTGHSSVTLARRTEFGNQARSMDSELGFEAYCASVERGNEVVPVAG